MPTPPIQYDADTRVMRTPRLLLRPLQPDDVDPLMAIYNDPDVTRHYELDIMTSREQGQSMLDFFLEHHDRYGLIDPATNQMIGTCGLFQWERENNMASLGYDLLPAFWGRGLMREATIAILAHGFAHKELNRVSALTAHENPRSARLLRSLGFSLEGSLREFAYWKGAYHDMHMFSLLRHDPPTEELMASLG